MNAMDKLKRNVSAALDALGDVADNASVENGKWQSAFQIAWEEIADLIRAAENEALERAAVALSEELVGWEAAALIVRSLKTKGTP